MDRDFSLNQVEVIDLIFGDQPEIIEETVPRTDRLRCQDGEAWPPVPGLSQAGTCDEPN